MRSASFPEADDIAAARCIGAARTARLYEAGVSATRPQRQRLPQILGDPYALSHVDGCGASSDSSAENSNRYSDTNCKKLRSACMRWVKERYEEFSMTNAKVDLHSPAPTSTNPQTYAKIAGVLLLLTIVAGGLGEVYIPSKLIAGNDATATANNIRASMLLFRTGFGVY